MTSLPTYQFTNQSLKYKFIYEISGFIPFSPRSHYLLLLSILLLSLKVLLIQCNISNYCLLRHSFQTRLSIYYTISYFRGDLIPELSLLIIVRTTRNNLKCLIYIIFELMLEYYIPCDMTLLLSCIIFTT